MLNICLKTIQVSDIKKKGKPTSGNGALVFLEPYTLIPASLPLFKNTLQILSRCFPTFFLILFAAFHFNGDFSLSKNQTLKGTKRE